VAEYSINWYHHDTSILAKISRQMECLIREAKGVQHCPNNMNGKEGFSLSRSWRPLIQILKEQKKALS